MFFMLQFLLWTHSSTNSQSQESVSFLRQPWLLLLDLSLILTNICDQICLRQTSALCHGRIIHLLATDTFRSCVGAQPAPATGLALAYELPFMGTLWAWQQTERSELCASNHRDCKGIQLFSSSEPYYSSFMSTHLLIFSCIECAFNDINFCPHFEHTNSGSLQASC